jgi:glycine cleavage system T protein (aminomethyltransferase)
LDRHEAAGARIVPFAGWEMPVQYEGIRQEHLAVRRRAGLFDVSHMGQIETSGPDAEKLLQRLLSNDVSKIPVGGAQYSVLCNERGGVLDDLFTYRLAGDRYLTVTNAANHEQDVVWFRKHAGLKVGSCDCPDVQGRDAAADHAMLALQGPDARAILARHLEGEAPARMHVTEASVAGVDALVCGTGYTGEDGVELLVPPEGAGQVWDALVGAGATPAGLGARDTLRLEACFHLYGNDLSEDRDPVGAGLGWCCKLDTGFIGAEALRALDPAEFLVPFVFTGPGVPRPGNAVVVDGAEAGVVTSGTHSPCLERGIGMAYVPIGAAEPGTPIEIDVRGKLRSAEVGEKPLYPKED